MATLDYKLEYFKSDKVPSDESVYIQLRTDVPSYIDLITKEDYSSLQAANQTAFLTGIFAIPGVVQVSSRAFRLYIEKSPAFAWEEILFGADGLSGVLNFVKTQVGASGLNELPGSPIHLSSVNDRRET